MTTGYRVRAILSLDQAEDGESVLALPSGTPSLLLEFATGEGVMQLGAIVTTDGGELVRSGVGELGVTIEFWADEAPNVATPGSEFALWYGGYVGKGRVEEDPPPLGEGSV